MSPAQVDLSQLAIERESPVTKRTGSLWRVTTVHYVVPLAIFVGFVVLLSISAARQLIPAKKVSVVPVIVMRGELRQAGVPLFQAAGWVEPRPTSVAIAALAAGVVEELCVVEGQEVREGQTIAGLITADAEIAVDEAKANVLQCSAELQRAEAEHAAATSLRDNPLHQKLPLAEARSRLAKATTELEKLPFLIKAAEAKLSVALRIVESKRRAGEAIPEIIVQKAEGDLAAAQAQQNELVARVPNLNREVDALRGEVRVLEQQIEFQIDEHRRVAEAKARVIATTALRDQANLQLRRAELDLRRMHVRAPMDGRILRVVATPGTRVMGLEEFAGQSSSTVVEMYDPIKLQVRADVRLQDVPLVTAGAPVQIKTASSDQTLFATVLRLTSTANIQKNTLEVKIALDDPPSMLRPDMLVTATFLSPELAIPNRPPTETERILIPKELTLPDDANSGGTGSLVWTVDADSRAKRCSVTLGKSLPSGLVEVTDGLTITDKLIATDITNLSVGQLVDVVGEDPRIGVQR